MESIEISKVVLIGKLCGKFLKDGAQILANFVSEFATSQSVREYFLMFSQLQD